MTTTGRHAGRVVVLGDLMVDVVATASVPLARGSDAPARVRDHGGGSGANVAAWLGAGAVLVCCVGDDAAGRAPIPGVCFRGVVHPTLPTGTCITIVEPDGERTFLPDRGANAALRPEDLPDVFRAGDHLHLSGYALLDEGPARAAALEALARARATGMTISVDPASSAPLAAVGPERFLRWIDGADLLLPNADEARILTGEEDPERAALALAAPGAEVVLTLGVGGALWTDGARVVRAPALPVAGAIDTTGAGDAFAAGWLGARLRGARVEEALAAACALAARAVAVPGGRPPTGA